MAKLTAAQRKALPASKFGEPAKRAYPMPDRNHAKFAEAMATKEERKGKLSPAAASRIRAKAQRLLSGGK
jgi:hypothetical protein